MSRGRLAFSSWSGAKAPWLAGQPEFVEQRSAQGRPLMICVQIWRPSLSRRGIFGSSAAPGPPASGIGASRAAHLLGVSLLSFLLVLALLRVRSLLLGQWWTRRRT